MTPNERLFSVGLLDKFDDAVRKGDRKLMVAMLEHLDLGGDAEKIADTILADPTRYGRLKR